jgi:hypothetical protein
MNQAQDRNRSNLTMVGTYDLQGVCSIASSSAEPMVYEIYGLTLARAHFSTNINCTKKDTLFSNNEIFVSSDLPKSCAVTIVRRELIFRTIQNFRTMQNSGQPRTLGQSRTL